MPSARLGGCETFWREWGEGDRRAVLLHCSLASSAAWNGVAHRLADIRRLQGLDLPGHGRSGRWDDSRDYMDQTMEMASGLIGDGEVDLVGHSFGAVACLRLALERPAQVRSLSLFEPVLFAAVSGQVAEESVAQTDLADAIAAGDRELAARVFTERWGAGEAWETISEDRRAALTARIHLVPAGAPAIYDDKDGLLRPGRLEALGAPVLLLEGALSPPSIAAINTVLASRLPAVTRKVIPGAAHMGPITHPDPIARAIRRHLGS
jgi:pimeloyl-ACP methyl ester carboxylesterase